MGRPVWTSERLEHVVGEAPRGVRWALLTTNPIRLEGGVAQEGRVTYGGQGIHRAPPRSVGSAPRMRGEPERCPLGGGGIIEA